MAVNMSVNMVIDCNKAVQEYLQGYCIDLDEEHKQLLAKAYYMDVNENYKYDEIRYIYENYFLSEDGELKSVQECKKVLDMLED